MRTIPDMRQAAAFQKNGVTNVLGIMSGTSLDGVDYALCPVTAGKIQLEKLWHVPFPRRLRGRLILAAQGQTSSHEVAQLHHDLGRFYAQGALKGIQSHKVDLVGLHGQTIFHNPCKPSATFQLGEPAYLVDELKVPVVFNFRAADLAAGGQGAPLATLFHKEVFGKTGNHVCFNNLGGISNVTSINWKKGESIQVLSFDTGPGNMLLDLAIQTYSKGKKQFDRNGNCARKGLVHRELLQQWLKHSYFRKSPPKSTGRELFGEQFLKKCLKSAEHAELRIEDLLATFTAFTAQTIVLNYRLYLPRVPDEVILSGGGANNSFLKEQIQTELLAWCGSIQLKTSEDYGWPHHAIEPSAFALLAYFRMCGLPGNLPETTGARRTAILGQVAEW